LFLFLFNGGFLPCLSACHSVIPGVAGSGVATTTTFTVVAVCLPVVVGVLN
jgi:hypothetical protein